MADGKSNSTVNKILILQTLVMVVTACGFLIFGNLQKAMSPGLGGMVALVPNIYFAYRTQLASGKIAGQILMAFYTAEVLKIILTAALFIIVLQIPGINFLTLLFGYIAVLSVHWFALIIWRND